MTLLLIMMLYSLKGIDLNRKIGIRLVQNFDINQSNFQIVGIKNSLRISFCLNYIRDTKVKIGEINSFFPSDFQIST